MILPTLERFDCIGKLSSLHHMLLSTRHLPHTDCWLDVKGWRPTLAPCASHSCAGLCDDSAYQHPLSFKETHVQVNETEDASGSSFNKLQVNDTLGDQECPRHGLHRSPFRVWFNVKLHEDLVRMKNVQLDQQQERQKVAKQLLLSCELKCQVN